MDRAAASGKRIDLPRRVGFVGRLSEEKRPDLFCALARRSPPGVEWHVYGNGPMGARLELEYGDTVRFHGTVTDLEPAWSTLGLLVMPSRFEGLPLAALEALTAGIPVLASRVGDLSSVVVDGQTGWLFESGDIRAGTLMRHCLASRIGVRSTTLSKRLCAGHVGLMCERISLN